MRLPVLLALLTLAVPAPAADLSQLAAAAQYKLDLLGFDEVDASSLTLRQLGALQTRRTVSFALGGLDGLRARGDVRNILLIDGYVTDDGVVVPGTRRDAARR